MWVDDIDTARKKIRARDIEVTDPIDGGHNRRGFPAATPGMECERSRCNAFEHSAWGAGWRIVCGMFSGVLRLRRRKQKLVMRQHTSGGDALMANIARRGSGNVEPFDPFDQAFGDWVRLMPFRPGSQFRDVVPDDLIRVDEYQDDDALVIRV